MTEAQRRASASYKARQEREGIKVVSVRLGALSRDLLKRLSEEHRLNLSDTVSVALLALDATKPRE